MPHQNEVNLPNLNRPKNLGQPPEKSDRHDQTQQAATQAAGQGKAALSVNTKQQLASLKDSIAKVQKDRQTALDQASDVLAYLHSPHTFQADLMSMTAKKLGLQPAGEPQPTEVSTLETLGDCFSGFADSVEYPAIAPHSAMGCLPM